MCLLNLDLKGTSSRDIKFDRKGASHLAQNRIVKRLVACSSFRLIVQKKRRQQKRGRGSSGSVNCGYHGTFFIIVWDNHRGPSGNNLKQFDFIAIILEKKRICCSKSIKACHDRVPPLFQKKSSQKLTKKTSTNIFRLASLQPNEKKKSKRYSRLRGKWARRRFICCRGPKHDVGNGSWKERGSSPVFSLDWESR